MINLDEASLNIYIDGSSYNRPRRGGLGVRFVWFNKDGIEDRFDYEPYGYKGATNQQMELQAFIHALKIVLDNNSPIKSSGILRIVVYTDSMYLANNFNNAKFVWPQKHWFTKEGKPVLNAASWKELIRLIKKTRRIIEVKWVKGKSDVHSKAVDKLAKRSAQKPFDQKISVVNVRKKKSKKTVDLGSVKMDGQRITIRIIDQEYLKVQKCYKYRFEVMSKKSPYYQNVDIVYSLIPLSAGHTYFVLLNENSKNSRINKVYREIG